MGRKNIFQRLFSRKHSEAITVIQSNDVGKPRSNFRNAEDYAREGYEKASTVYNCTNLIADKFADVPLVLYRKLNSGIEQVESHEVLNLLEKPSPLKSGYEFKRDWASFLYITGNSFIEAFTGKDASNVKAKPRELYIPPPARFQIVPGSMGIPAEYIIKNGAKEKKYPVTILGESLISHARLFHPRDMYYGLSPIQVASLAVDMTNELNTWNLSLLQNSAKPSGLFIWKGEANLEEEDRDNINSVIRTDVAGSKNAGKNILLEGDFDYQQLGLSPKDMDFLMTKKTSKQDICEIFRTPGQLVGIEGSQTFANYEQANLQFHIDTVIPLVKYFCSMLNMYLLPKYGESNLFFGFDEDQIPALEPLREKKWNKVSKSDFLTINEKRESLGYGRYEDPLADQLYIPTSLVPLSFNSEDDIQEEEIEMEDFEDEKGINGPSGSLGFSLSQKKSGAGLQEVPCPILRGEVKFFNIDTKNEKERRSVWRFIDRKRRTFEKRFRIKVDAQLKKDIADVIDSLNESVKVEDAKYLISSVLSANQEDMVDIFKKEYRRIGLEFGSDVLKSAKHQGISIETKDDELRFESFLNFFVDEQAAKRVSRISSTTEKKLKSAVNKTLEEGETLDFLKKEIKEKMPSINKSRAITIARTEVHTVSSSAQRGAAKALRTPNIDKEWISSKDDRTRGNDSSDATNHLAMDGETVKIDESFQVPSKDGSDTMEGPGDVNAPADQVIMCRCVQTFKIK